jgi:hypothetical protein
MDSPTDFPSQTSESRLLVGILPSEAALFKKNRGGRLAAGRNCCVYETYLSEYSLIYVSIHCFNILINKLG